MTPVYGRYRESADWRKPPAQAELERNELVVLIVGREENAGALVFALFEKWAAGRPAPERALVLRRRDRIFIGAGVALQIPRHDDQS